METLICYVSASKTRPRAIPWWQMKLSQVILEHVKPYQSSLQGSLDLKVGLRDPHRESLDKGAPGSGILVSASPRA